MYMPKLVVANWKSHKNQEDVHEWMAEFSTARPENFKNVRVAIAPPVVFVPLLAEKLKNSLSTVLAVQDLSPFPPGAYTGALSAENLEGFDVRYALLGHSERRRYFHETNQEVANKVEVALKAGITPIVCVDTEYIRTQAAAIAEEYLAKCIVAYEPLTAIGSGISQSPEEVVAALSEITKAFGQVSTIYGGSVSQDNVADYVSLTDGVLVASNSLDAKSFTSLLKVVESRF
jgi:triosephosphate isomerase